MKALLFFVGVLGCFGMARASSFLCPRELIIYTHEEKIPERVLAIEIFQHNPTTGLEIPLRDIDPGAIVFAGGNPPRRAFVPVVLERRAHADLADIIGKTEGLELVSSPKIEMSDVVKEVTTELLVGDSSYETGAAFTIEVDFARVVGSSYYPHFDRFMEKLYVLGFSPTGTIAFRDRESNGKRTFNERIVVAGVVTGNGRYRDMLRNIFSLVEDDKAEIVSVNGYTYDEFSPFWG